MERPGYYKHSAPLEPGEMGMPGYYKHSAPLEPGGLGEPRFEAGIE